ncbi:Nn.00g088320.m01.CDS01 [Neocucurbitaria sp. VM-36]
MASAAVGTKRSFATMNQDSMTCNSFSHTNQLPLSNDVSQPENPGSYQRHKVSVEGIPPASVGSIGLTTPQDTSALTSDSSECHRIFESDASIVLIGMRGTGKSTLAVIASIACRRRVVDIDDLFQEATGFYTAKYRKQFGAANHNLRQEELLRTALQTHNKGAIIVCNGGSLERNGQALMQDFARTHPVIHIVRDLHSVHEYLKGVELSRLRDMLAFTAPILRRCSNYEFYNMSETIVGNSDTVADEPTAPAFLTLKRAQRTFLKFLSLITSREHTNGPVGSSIPPLEPGYPLSDMATELRKYTCAVQVPLEDLLAEDVNIQRFELGSDAFEVVVDPRRHQLTTDLVDNISSCISKVRRSTVVPIIYHVLLSDEGRASYLEHVHHGLRMAPEFATVDLSLDRAKLTEVFASRGITKIIGNLHADKPWDDPSWIIQYDFAVRLGCTVVRFTRPARSTDDDVPTHSLRSTVSQSDTRIPLICYNTGRAGRRSVCFNRHLTPVVPSSLREKPDFATKLEPNTSWLTAREVTQALYSSFTFDPMDIYIIGARLGYSVSPAMHNAAYDSCGMPHQFIRVQSSSLNSLKELVHKPNFGGSIVIQPFKIEVISLADSLSQHARAIGAVNTLIPVRHLKTDGTIPSDLDLFQERNQAGPIQALYGDNTEWIGIRSCVRRGLSPANAVRPTTSGLVIGAGGMARAAVYALLQLGVKNIVIFNRTLEKAEKLIAHFNRLVLASTATTGALSVSRQDSHSVFHTLKSREDLWPEEIRQPTIILSCIPADPIDDSPAAHFTLPAQWMKSPTGGVIMEIAYKTLNTPLMQQVRDEGSRVWTYMDGLDFLPEQAFAQFELFTGKRAPRRVMREEVLRAWRDEQGNADAEMVQRRLKAIDDQEP